MVVGTGYTGRRVFEALAPDSTIGLSRSAASVAGSGLRTLDLDRDDAAVGDLPTPYRLLYTVPPPGEGDGDPRLERLLSMLDPRPLRLVYLSTSGVYGDRRGERVDESAPPAPVTPRARRRLAAEQRLETWCDENRVERIVLRVPGIYGPGRLGLDRLAGGSEVLRDADAGPGNRIHVDDLVACCLAALTGDVPAGIYNVGDGNDMSASEFTRLVAGLAGLPRPSDVSLDEARERWSPMRLSFVLESRRLDTTRMRDVLGVEPVYPNPEQGIVASLAGEPG